MEDHRRNKAGGRVPEEQWGGGIPLPGIINDGDRQPVGDTQQLIHPTSVPYSNTTSSTMRERSRRSSAGSSRRIMVAMGIRSRRSSRTAHFWPPLALALLLSTLPQPFQAQGQDTSSPDMKALLQIKKELYANQPPAYGQAPITMLDGWDLSSDPCDPQDPWVGVTCSGPRVIKLNLEMSRLGGPIPTTIAQLAFLTSLHFSLNHFNSTLPEQFSALTNLRELDLNFNQLTGTIPDSYSSLKALKQLKLGSNALTGSIPESLSILTSLTYLDLSSNLLTGPIPNLIDLFNLEHLLLTANQLTGTLPEWLDELPLLKEVSVRKNQLTGSIPEYNFALSLEHLYLGFNNLTGSLPSTIGSLTSLSTLFIPSNNIQGSIPQSFFNLSSLSLLDLSSNPELGGTIPDFLEGLNQLALLQLTGCSFNGTIPSSLSSLTNLKEMYLDSNELSGSIPSDLGNLTGLTQLYLSDNQLTGGIPDSLCQLTDLENLNLARNTLNGTVPPCLANIPNMRSLVLSENLLAGPVPGTSNADLNFLYDRNCFDGAANQLVTCAPGSPAALAPPAVTEPPPEPNTTEAPESPPDGTAAAAAPSEENPPQIVIPGLGSANDNTTAPITTTTTTTSSSNSDSGSGGASSSSSSGLPTWLWLLIMLLGFIIVAILAYLFSYSITSFAAGKGNKPDQLPVAEYSLSKIKKATQNFTTVYGRGSFGVVYLAEDFRKGCSEPRAIIKRASDPQKMGEFLFKCKVEVLARARHRYLVNLLGYCIGRGERILVYEFLPNGTLFDRLHRPELEPLPWDVRVRISVSVACALEHLHHGLTPPLVHRAVTSSNILLAADMSAKLSDFGIARGSLGHTGSFDDTPRRRSKARGGPGSGGSGGAGGGRGSGGSESSTTPGILQLEKVDVYGFGVVLLELITGQKAMKEVHITSVAAPFLEDPQMMPLMVDPQLGGYFNQQELVELATIARDCVRDDAMARPSMRDVLSCMEDRLQVDANLFENLDANGEDMLTDKYAHSLSITSMGSVPVLSKPQHAWSASAGAAPTWQALESFASSVKNALISPGNSTRHQPVPAQGEQDEDFEMSSLLVVGDSENSSTTHSRPGSSAS